MTPHEYMCNVKFSSYQKKKKGRGDDGRNWTWNYWYFVQTLFFYQACRVCTTVPRASMYWHSCDKLWLETFFIPRTRHVHTSCQTRLPIWLCYIWTENVIHQPLDQRQLVPPCRNSLNTQLCSSLKPGSYFLRRQMRYKFWRQKFAMNSLHQLT